MSYSLISAKHNKFSMTRDVFYRSAKTEIYEILINIQVA